ncbi:MAG: hypothetical protein JWO02_1074 [Solirubrobacterales bacterium]|nr:hypothetical protein [Solirubrobacterales bacterium]
MFDAPRTISDVDPTVVLAAFGAIAAAAVVYAAVMAVRLRDVVPLAVCLGAGICALNEPIFDVLGKITYADDNPTMYSAMGRDIPVFLVIGYIPWVGLVPWILARRIQAGLSRRSMHVIAVSSFLSVVVVETVGTSLKAWTYYGEPPLKYLGVAPQMAAVPILGAFCLYALQPWATGRRRGLMLFVPMLPLPAVYASASFPMYIAGYADVGAGVRWLAAATSMFFCVATVVCTTAAVDRWRGTPSASPPVDGRERVAAPARVPAGAGGTR